MGISCYSRYGFVMNSDQILELGDGSDEFYDDPIWWLEKKYEGVEFMPLGYDEFNYLVGVGGTCIEYGYPEKLIDFTPSPSKEEVDAIMKFAKEFNLGTPDWVVGIYYG